MKRLFIAAIAALTITSCATAETKQAITPDNARVEILDPLITNISQSDFKKRVEDYSTQKWEYKGNMPAVVDFYADWCGPCKMLGPIMEEVAEQFKGKVRFYKVNVDNAPALSRAYGVSSIPMIMFIPMEGEPYVHVGLLNKAAFTAAVEKHCLKK